MRFKLSRVLSVAFLALLFESVESAGQMVVTPDRISGVYHVGDTVRWSVVWKGEGDPPAAHYTVLKGGLTRVDRGELDFIHGAAGFTTRFDAPGTLLVEVEGKSADGREQRAVSGAVAAPDRIALSAPPPADFDDFWKAKLVELKHVPANPKLESADSGRTNVVYWRITMDNIRGTHIEGQIARPARGRKFPGLLIVQWAGVYPLQKSWVTDRAAEGWLALNIEAHDLPIDKPEAFYRRQFDGPLKDYWSIGNDDRDTSYFLRMYLSCYRAVEYLTMRRDWNGKTLAVMGDSQGGQQALMIAGLHPDKITAALALVPAGCDMLGPEVGRAPGWPDWYFNTKGKDANKVRQASRYYDVANFAAHIRCPVLVGLGLVDETCPPAGVLAAVNQIKCPKEVVILPRSAHQDHHGTQAPYNERRYGVWLPGLRQGRPVPPATRGAAGSEEEGG